MIQLALYVSDAANLLEYVSGRQEDEAIYTPKGDVAGTKPRLFAQFSRGACPDWALDEVSKRLTFRGHPDELPLTARMGVFDSDLAAKERGWSDEDKKVLEDWLDSRQGATNGFIRIELPRVDAPWPKITELTVHGRRTPDLVAEKMVETAQDIGVELDVLLRFVKQELGNHGWDDRLLVEIDNRIPRVVEATEELVEA